MQEQRADALQLAVGKPASLLQNGSARPNQREPLSDVQIQGLLREIATGDTATQLGSAEPVAFQYRSPYGEIRVEVKSGAGGATVLRPSGGPPAAPAAQPVSASSPASVTTPSGASPADLRN